MNAGPAGSDASELRWPPRNGHGPGEPFTHLDVLLMTCLEAAVPMWQERWREWGIYGRVQRAAQCADIIAHEKGDGLQVSVGQRGTGSKSASGRGGQQRGETAGVFNALAEGLAIGSFQPGGVEFAGHRWDANRPTDYVAPPHRPCSPAPDDPAKLANGLDLLDKALDRAEADFEPIDWETKP